MTDTDAVLNSREYEHDMSHVGSNHDLSIADYSVTCRLQFFRNTTCLASAQTTISRLSITVLLIGYCFCIREGREGRYAYKCVGAALKNRPFSENLMKSRSVTRCFGKIDLTVCMCIFIDLFICISKQPVLKIQILKINKDLYVDVTLL